MADAGEIATLNNGPGNSKNCRCRFPALSSTPSPGKASPNPFDDVRSSKSSPQWEVDRSLRTPISNQSYSSAGKASRASRKARPACLFLFGAALCFEEFDQLLLKRRQCLAERDVGRILDDAGAGARSQIEKGRVEMACSERAFQGARDR